MADFVTPIKTKSQLDTKREIELLLQSPLIDYVDEKPIDEWFYVPASLTKEKRAISVEEWAQLDDGEDDSSSIGEQFTKSLDERAHRTLLAEGLDVRQRFSSDTAINKIDAQTPVKNEGDGPIRPSRRNTSESLVEAAANTAANTSYFQTTDRPLQRFNSNESLPSTTHKRTGSTSSLASLSSDVSTSQGERGRSRLPAKKADAASGTAAKSSIPSPQRRKNSVEEKPSISTKIGSSGSASSVSTKSRGVSPTPASRGVSPTPRTPAPSAKRSASLERTPTKPATPAAAPARSKSVERKAPASTISPLNSARGTGTIGAHTGTTGRSQIAKETKPIVNSHMAMKVRPINGALGAANSASVENLETTKPEVAKIQPVKPADAAPVIASPRPRVGSGGSGIPRLSSTPTRPTTSRVPTPSVVRTAARGPPPAAPVFDDDDETF
eukprot:Colp12_sorted_trinity150504_noHs@16564